MAEFAQLKTKPKQPPRRWKIRKFPALAARDFLEHLAEGPRLLVGNRNHLFARQDLSLGASPQTLGQIMFVDEVLDLGATAEQRKQSRLFYLADQATEHRPRRFTPD